jgi:hypothetical protein
MTRQRPGAPRRSRHTLPLLVATVLASMLAVGALAAPPRGGGGKPGSGGDAPGTFEISGHVDDLAPTVVRQMPLKLENAARFDIVVEGLAVAAGDAGPGCPASALAVGVAEMPVLVPARGETTVTVSVALIDDPPDACQGATFPLTYTGTAGRP